ncbi:MAG: alpha/beta hydrolase [Treponema sp.]|nr:alpha/beta hydrolase [Treponema sp.]
MNKNDDKKSAIKKLRSLAFSTKQEVEIFRRTIDEKFSCAILPNSVECNEQKFAEIPCDMLVPEIYSLNKIMIYIHGGCFVGGSKKAWRSFCASLAAATSCRIVIPEFRLAPENAHPAALEDLQNVFRAVFTEEQIACSLNSEEEQALPEIIIAADGSGASQAMALILSLRERYRNCIKQVILFSPWLNFSANSQIIKNRKSRDEILAGECLKRSSEIYANGENLESPLISPMFITAESLKNFPPVFIQIGSREILLEDAKEFQKIISEAGGVCQLDVWEDMIFMFQMADEFLAESHLAVERVGRLVRLQTEIPDEDTLKLAPILDDDAKRKS